MSLFGPPNIRKLQDKRQIKGLIKAMYYEKDWRIRADAATALGSLQDPQAVPALLAVAYDDFANTVRQSATNALVTVGPKGVDRLIEGLTEFGQREVAIYVLSKLGEPAVAPLQSVLEHGWFQNASQAAARTLAQIGNLAAIKALIRALILGHKDIRKIAGKALVQVGQPALAPLKEVLKQVKRPVPDATWVLDQLESQNPRKRARRKKAS